MADIGLSPKKKFKMMEEKFDDVLKTSIKFTLKNKELIVKI